MLGALSQAIADALEPAERRTLLLTILGTAVLLVALVFGASLLVAALHVTGIHWLNLAIDVLGGAAALFIAWLIFPAMAVLILGFFLDHVIASIESRHYPELPEPRRIGIRQSLMGAVRLAVLAVVLNLLVLPLYLLLPVINFVLFFGINGYLVSREYFEAVACRRLDPGDLWAMWRRYRIRLVAAGVVVAMFSTIPVLNLAAPLIGVAFMLHLFEGLRRRAARA